MRLFQRGFVIAVVVAQFVLFQLALRDNRLMRAAVAKANAALQADIVTLRTCAALLGAQKAN